MKTGLEQISLERWEQQFKHKRTIEIDFKNNKNNELSVAASKLLSYPPFPNLEMPPLGWDKEIWDKMKNKPYKDRLVIAGALIAAEIDRLQYVSDKIPVSDGEE